MKINWVTVPNSDVLTKQALLLQSGNYPDVFWSGNFTQSQVLQYAQQGIFVPLNDLLKQYAPNVMKAIASDPGLKRDVTAPDGNIYGLPGYNWCDHCYWSSKYWINTALLKKYGLKMPTTTTEFEQVLKVLKQHHIIPLTGAPDTAGWHASPITFLMNAFIYDDGSDYFYIDHGNVQFAPIQPQWKQGLQYMHKLYTEGLIDKSAFTHNMDIVQTDVAQGKVGVVPNGSSSSFINNWGTPQSHTFDWLTVPPLKGPDGVQWAAFYGNGPSGITFTITNKASEAEKIALVKLLNFIYTPVGTEMLDFGPAGEYWNFPKKGQRGEDGSQALFVTDWNKFYNGNAMQNVGWNQMGPIYQSKAWRRRNYADSPFSPNGLASLLRMETEKNYAGHQPKKVYPGAAWVPPAEAQQYAMYQTNINNFVNQWTASFVTGGKSLDNDWNTYVTGVKNLGLDQYLQMAQKAMGTPFDTSSFAQNMSTLKFLESIK